MSGTIGHRRGFGMFTLAMVALFVGLGVWQLQRRIEKHALIAALTERLAAAPAPLPSPSEWNALEPAKDEFRRVQESSREQAGGGCPCLLLLDNMPPAKTSATIEGLRSQGLVDHVLTEASGNISESNIEEYAACGVDAISMGALTHSACAIDICERL